MRNASTILTAACIGLGLCRAASASCAAELMAQEANQLLATMEADQPDTVLAHGAGCYSDDPANPGVCDWNTEIKTDTHIGNERRLLVLTSNHRTGSGAWDLIRIYGCVAERPRLLFRERFLYGTAIEQSSAERLVLVSGAWTDGDPSCCPTGRIRQTFVWEPKHSGYVWRHSQRLPAAKK